MLLDDARFDSCISVKFGSVANEAGEAHVMRFEAFEYERRPGEWCVEAQDENGEFHRSFFTGPRAEKDANQYAVWRNAQVDTERRAVA